ncbi:UTRA domain-containing protein [Rhizobium sp. A22-96]
MVRYQDVRRGILARIRGGEWPPGHRVPSESMLAAMFGASKMTADRAVRELVREGEVTRTPRVGSFVASKHSFPILLQMRDTADHVRRRGKVYTGKVISMSEEPATPAISEEFAIPCSSPIFHSVMVHFEDAVAVQLEERFVHPIVAPDYFHQDFSEQTPATYLSRVCHLQKAECRIEAVAPAAWEQKLLGMLPGDACLSIRERSVAKGVSASIARFVSPADRFQLDTGRLSSL